MMTKQAGFTLIEIMVVVVIIGILAGLIVPNVIGRDDQARVAAAKSDLKALATDLQLYKMDHNRYPTTDEGLEAVRNGPVKDPWGNPYQYISPGVDGPFDLFSFGADGAEGGEGFNADIYHTDP